MTFFFSFFLSFFLSFALEFGLGWVGLGWRGGEKKMRDGRDLIIMKLRFSERERDLFFASSTTPGMIVRSKTTCRSVYEGGFYLVKLCRTFCVAFLSYIYQHIPFSCLFSFVVLYSTINT